MSVARPVTVAARRPPVPVALRLAGPSAALEIARALPLSVPLAVALRTAGAVVVCPAIASEPVSAARAGPAAAK